MITPIQSNDEWLADVERAKADESIVDVWWLGQSGFLVQYQGRHLLFDPYLSDSLTEKYVATDKPHVRMTELVIDPARLDFVDVVTSSHNHTDHLDAETLGPLMAANADAAVIVPTANREFAANRLQVPLERLTPIDPTEDALQLGPFRIHAVPAAHETVELDEGGKCTFIGLVVECGDEYTIYHSGDTMLFDGMVETLKRHQIDLALLPINGRRPERRVAGNLWGDEAANLANQIGASMVIPCHYDMFEFNTETPDRFESECKKLNQPYRIMKCGERLSVAR
ncbi:MBL fold metallo-hydrolase [Planctomycetota bacterium]